MNDALLVCGFERLGNLPGDRERLIDGRRALRDAIRQRLALDQLHDQGANAIGRLESVNGGDVRMVQRGKCPGFALESREPLRVLREGVGQHLDGDLPAEGGVGRAPDLSHAAGAEWRDDFVGAEPRADSQRHGETARIIWGIPNAREERRPNEERRTKH